MSVTKVTQDVFFPTTLSTVASAATPDIFALTVGNTVNYTGTATATGLTASPQAGAQRTLVCAAAAVFTAGANMLIDGVTSGQNFTAAAGDKVLVIAVTTSQFRLTPMPVSGGYAPPGVIWEYGGSSAPGGWLLMNQDVSRTTYAALFAVVGTTYGAGDGSTTFGVRKEGRTSIAAGAGTTKEVSTTSSANGFVVSSNNTKWITGMPIVISALSGFTFSGSAGPTYFVVRVSATNVRLATTLALAQAVTPDLTLSGTGSATLTYTMTARTLGEVGGEEVHAQSITELLAHTHTQGAANIQTAVDGGAGARASQNTTGSTGGNVAMNIMSPFVVSNYIIKI